MLESYDTVAANVLTQLRYAKNCHRVFGRRYCNDKRYRIKVISSFGSCSMDTFHISVGSYHYFVKVFRIKNAYNNAYRDSYYEIGYYDTNDLSVLWNEDFHILYAGGVY